MSAATFGVATDQATKDRIYASAAKQGLSVSAYVLQWLPEYAPDRSTKRQAAYDREQRKAQAKRYEAVPTQ